MHVTWPDIDFGNHVVRVKAKPKLGFIPKDWEEREVPIPDRLLNSLRRHKAAAPANHALVFATCNGRLVHNFLRQCKSIAWRAGLNCGLCDRGRLTDYYRDPVVQEAIICLERENATDIRHGAPQFNLNGNGRESPDAVAEYCLWLMDRDRKTTPLKTIRGLIWQDAFKRGELQSEVFPDV